jgi:hypothetical protein
MIWIALVLAAIAVWVALRGLRHEVRCHDRILSGRVRRLERALRLHAEGRPLLAEEECDD